MKILVPSRYAQRISTEIRLKHILENILYYDFQTVQPGLALRAARKFGLISSTKPNLVIHGPDSGYSSADIQGVVLDWGAGQAHLDLLHARARNIRWLHSMSSGIDHLPLGDIGDRGQLLTSSKGLRHKAVSEYAMGLIYLGAKHFLEHHGKSVQREVRSDAIEGARLCILGTGSIGQALCRLAGANGMRVSGVNRSGRKPEGFDTAYPTEALSEAVAKADAIVITLPFTPETNKLVDKETFAAMTRKPYLVNIGRDAIVDGEAMKQAIQNGSISGAALDIDPQGKNHPCHGEPNVLFTNHSAYSLAGDKEDLFQRMVNNLLRFSAGDELLGTIDLSLGY
ncbi:NAD(P)-dependent oxidoreductase [uncultured Pseudodesulfovibrio sp.]|uniref:NAD(P)-dependent oxidoreductase n=1 Tax=uncultured Pseudodesulfovibrio sp. TaxID=2035858 RepID=UPI0029C8E3D0|nr:NAD(P)-dependent oxidoreductase [uncultured Pseudodesulfovibrio sp.]